jgi:DeoR/GlpR family transcriptional regulator of sugar metabolism
MPRKPQVEVDLRRRKILEMLCCKENLAIVDLAGLFNTSHTTIWRDLEQLEKYNYIKKTNNGKVQKNRSLALSPDIIQRANVNHIQKAQIALRAIELVEEGNMIGLDASTTVLELARLFFLKAKLRVVSNNLLLAHFLKGHPSLNLMMAGGALMMMGYSTEGDVAVETLKRFTYDKVFLSANAVSADFGLSNEETFETGTKKALLENAKQRIVLADSSKIGKRAQYQCCPMDEVDILVTNQDVDSDSVAAIRDRGVTVIFCDDP